MTIPASVMAKMATLGLSADQADAVAGMLAAVEDATGAQYEAAAEVSRSKARARVQKWRERNVTERNTTSRNGLRVGDAPVEDKISNLDIEPVEKKDTPRAALMAILDETHAVAVVEHRQRIRKPLTAYAAAKLASKFAQCPDPNAAADKMIGNGWQGFEPEWMSKPDARGSPSNQRPPTAQEILKARRQEQPNHDDRPPIRPMLIASR